MRDTLECIIVRRVFFGSSYQEIYNMLFGTSFKSQNVDSSSFFSSNFGEKKNDLFL